MQEINVSKNQIIYENSEDAFVLLKKGVVILEVFESSWEALTIFKDHNLIGLDKLFLQQGDVKIKYRIKALTPCEVTIIDRDFFINHMYIYPNFLFDSFESSGYQLQSVISNYLSIRETLERRTALLLLEWGKILNGKKENLDVFPAYIHKVMFSQALKSSHQRVCRIIADWEKQGIVDRRPDYFVVDRERLNTMYKTS